MFRPVIVVVVLASFAAPPGKWAGNTEGPGPVSAEIDPEIFRPVLVPGGSLISRGIRAAESEAYFRVLDHARRVDPAALDAAAAGFLVSRRDVSKSPEIRRRPIEEFPVFVDLYNNVRRPEVYLGKPVMLSGHVRSVVEMPASENEYGIEMLYEVWLFTTDSQQHPVVLVMSSVPERLLEEVRRLKAANRPVVIDGVSGSGYFFKMYGYPAADAYRFAPLVLGGSLKWSPRRPGETDRSLPLALAVGLVVFSLPIGWFVWRNRREDRRHRSARSAEAQQTLDWIDDGIRREDEDGAGADQSVETLEET